MIQTTPAGKTLMLKAVTDTLKELHLFVNDGELVGYGYSSVLLDPAQWDDGVYPDVLWEFNGAEQPARVMGYYVTNEQGEVMYSESFPASEENEDDLPGFVIGKQGDRVRVGMRLNLFVARDDG